MCNVCKGYACPAAVIVAQVALVRTVVAGTMCARLGPAGSRRPMGPTRCVWGGGVPKGEALNT